MKDDMIKRASKGRNSLERLNRLREELHHLLLQAIDRKDGFRDLCFVGGTALRVLYGLDRFSEDLDFSTSVDVRPSFDLAKLAKAVHLVMESSGVVCEITPVKSVSAVQSCFFRFSGLVELLDNSFRKGQKLAVKVEVDTQPPAGAVETVSPVTGARLYSIRHFDLPSLFAGKLHAVLYRQFTKGRDLYDFLWYVGSAVGVNVRLLENAAAQSEGRKIEFSADTLRHALITRFHATDFVHARQDVERFVVDPATLSLFDETMFVAAVQRLQIA